MSEQAEITVTIKTPIVLCQVKQCKHADEGLCSLLIISIRDGYSPDCVMYEKSRDEEEE